MANLCNVDGRITPEADARVPVLDRGFLFGDSIYEVVRTVGAEPFGWPEHWQRLVASAAAIRLRLDLDEAAIARRIAATLAASGPGDRYVRVVVSRGAGSAPNIDLATATGAPCWVVMVRELAAMSGAPSRLAVIDRLRNDRRALDPAAKSGNYLNNVLGLAEAKDLGATDCLMCNAQGFVTEASTSNVFARIDGVWLTPRLDDGILADVRQPRQQVRARDAGGPAARRRGLPVEHAARPRAGDARRRSAAVRRRNGSGGAAPAARLPRVVRRTAAHALCAAMAPTRQRRLSARESRASTAHARTSARIAWILLSAAW